MNKIISVVILICAVIILIHTLRKDESRGTPVNKVVYETSVPGFTDVAPTDGIPMVTTSVQSSFVPGPGITAEGVRVLDVPYISQDEYPTGCELVSSSMLLAYYGFETTAGKLIDEGYIEDSEFYEVNGVKYGGDPNKVFIGTPYDASSFGCYSGAIVTMLEKFLSDTQYKPMDTSGTELSQLCSTYIDNGTPVLVWASIDMLESYMNESCTWIIEETGESFTWRSNEHCLVLVGYDDFNYYFNDPMRGKSYTYAKDLSEQRYSELGMQSIVILGN